MKTLLLLSTFSFLLSSSAFPQGILTPPVGPPGPTMKTLDQVEARTIVNATNTPGNSNTLFQITSAGSYYLTANITGMSGKSGITISADNVTLDLNGFAVIGVNGSLDGIIAPFSKNACVRNGTVQFWPQTGINAIAGINCQFEHLRVSQNSIGIQVFDGHILTDVSAEKNTDKGILVGNGCTLTNCSAKDNGSASNGAGIAAASFCTIIGCTVSSNTSIGIVVSGDCTIKDCTASQSGTDGISSTHRSSIINCTANGNGSERGIGNGISAGDDALVKNCAASNNAGSGITVLGASSVFENECNHNIVDGISASGGINRIDGNHTNYNGGYGIHAGADWVVRNTSSNNAPGGDFIPATGADIGPIQTASTATNPFANLR